MNNVPQNVPQHKQQKFLGEALVGGILDTVLEKALDKVIQSPTIPIRSTDTKEAIKQVVKKEIETAVGDQQVFKTNNEPITKSPVSIGSIIAGLGGIGAVVVAFSDGVLTEEETAIVGAGIASFLGAALAIWGRWFAKKPLGT